MPAGWGLRGPSQADAAGTADAVFRSSLFQRSCSIAWPEPEAAVTGGSERRQRLAEHSRAAVGRRTDMLESGRRLTELEQADAEAEAGSGVIRGEREHASVKFGGARKIALGLRKLRQHEQRIGIAGLLREPA